MARVICELPNASGEISGIKFTEDRGQMISEEITEEQAEQFAKINGYKVVSPKRGKQAESEAPEQADEELVEQKPATRGPGRPKKDNPAF